MKKSKLLLTITTIGTLSATVPLVSLTSCSKATLQSIKVSVKGIDDLSKPLPICYTVHKSDILVMGKYSDNSEREVTNWVSEDFGTEDSITFTSEGTYPITIKVGTQFKEKLTFIIQESVPAQVSHLVMTLGCGSDFTTGQKLEVYSGDIKLEPKHFNYTPDASIKDYITINQETGLISVKGKVDAIVEGDITITRKLPSSSNAYDKCHVVIDKNYFTMQDSYYDDDYDTASVGINGVGDSGILSIPETVVRNGKTYTVTGIVKGGDNIKDVKFLNLPNTLTTIPANLFNDPSFVLNTIRYCGTKKEWDQKVYYGTGSNWASYLTMGVYCYDGMYLFENRQESEYFAQKEYSGQKYDLLAMPKAVGAAVRLPYYSVKFLYSQLQKPGKDPSKFNNLFFKDSSWGSLGGITVTNVFLDGKQLVKDDTESNNWYTYSNDTITIGAKTGFELTYNSEVVVRFSTPIFAQNSIHFAACEIE